MVSKFISSALNNENITIYGDGKQTRTFCYIDDNIESTTNAFFENKFINDVVNIGGNIEITILELAETIIEATGSKSSIVHVSALEDGDMTRRNPDITKMQTLLGHELTSLKDGLEKVLVNTTHIV